MQCSDESLKQLGNKQIVTINSHIEPMLSSLFPFIYGLALIILLWRALREMGNIFSSTKKSSSNQTLDKTSNDDRTGRLTIHPELLDQQGRITDEELLTVRFSEETDPPNSADTSAE